VIYDWYRGSDATGAIARKFVELSAHTEKIPDLEQLLPEFEALVAQERDPNMRGFFLWYVAAALYAREKKMAALDYYQRAYREFDILEASFPSIAQFYLATCRECSGDWSEDIGHDDRGIPEAALMELAVLLWGASSSLSPVNRAAGLGILAVFFIRKAEDWRSLPLCELARVADSRGHRCQTEDPASLWGLFEANYYLGCAKECQRIAEMLDQVDYEGQFRQWVQRWGLPKEADT